MANNKREQEFVDSLYDTYKGSLDFFAYRVKKNPDVGFHYKIENKEYSFFLESKVCVSGNKANYAKQLLAEILINRKLNKSNIKLKANVSYGILLQYNNTQFDGIYDALKAYYTTDDWNKFGEDYGCKFVFLYDKEKKILYYCDWANFIKDVSQIKKVEKE